MFSLGTPPIGILMIFPMSLKYEETPASVTVLLTGGGRLRLSKSSLNSEVVNDPKLVVYNVWFIIPGIYILYI